MLWAYASGNRIPSSSRQARIVRLGIDEVLKQDATMLHTSTCEQCGTLMTKRKRKPLTRFCNKACSARFTATHGRKPTFTAEHRKAQSKRMIDKLTSKPENVYSWQTIKGWYKGVFFRSSYEYRFMQWLETKGVSILHDLKSNAFCIPYTFEGNSHSYLPDFYVPKLGTVYEVKSSYAAKNDPRVLIKTLAAQNFFQDLNIKYSLVSEHDFPIPRQNSKKDIAQDQCVFLLETLPSNDSLTMLFSEQRKFMELLQKERDFPKFPVDLSTKPGQKLIKDISHECMHELFESVHLLKNSKSHRKTDVPEFDRASFLEELADVLHYLVEIFIASNISPEEMYKAYMKKGTINVARILESY